MKTATVLVVGSGAREHALARAMAREGHAIICAPGNAGTLETGRNVPIAADDVPKLVEFATAEKVDLVVVGPEAPLVAGLVDALEEKGIRAFGPKRAGAELEGSKVFMKQFLARHGIPTAAFHVFEEFGEAVTFIRKAARPLVVKADGLAAGKGVVVAKDADEAIAAAENMMVKRAFGDAGRRVVIEELLPGEEASFHVVVCGDDFVELAPAQDHKRIFDGDKGPNTGGMGAYAPAPVVTELVQKQIHETIVVPTLRGLAIDQIPFRGVLFVGLMIEQGIPRVLEFNVRFGDPETSVLVPLYDGSWFALLNGVARGSLAGVSRATRKGAALSVVMAAEGYPGPVKSGDTIDGLDQASTSDVSVYHAGTKRNAEGAVVTAGGRVLNVAAVGETLRDAQKRAYEVVDSIHWRGEQHRRDIGYRALTRV